MRLDGTRFTLGNVRPEETVMNIKKKVDTLLKHNDNLLQDPYPLSDYSIANESTLILYQIFHVHIYTSPSDKIDLSISSTEKVPDLKQKIEERLRIPVGHQILYRGDIELEDHRTIAKCGIKSGDNICLIHRYSGTMQIDVKTFEGKSIGIFTVPDEKILKIKEKLDEYINTKVERIKLIYKGKELINELTVKEYGITKNSKIYLVARLPGG
ncbi:9516_t:CDS:2 [Acaulospora colombiana]|uniref:9516_t:CDS:1 n=1 Tax=Acaulospora colombiana TaxID=27376 RepID=A0ACA9M9S6_9GLOM|nr:9516_t:CDS:2 [Acaulospora colombiana]